MLLAFRERDAVGQVHVYGLAKKLIESFKQARLRLIPMILTGFALAVTEHAVVDTVDDFRAAGAAVAER